MDMRPEDQQQADRFWGRYRLSFALRSRASIPVYLAGFGSLCWELAALCGPPNGSSLLDGVWLAAVLVGAGAMLLGFIRGLLYHRFKVAAWAVAISLLSPPLWLGLFLKLHPLFGFDPSPGFLLRLGFLLQLPLVLVAVWQSAWQKRVKTMLTAFALTSLLGVIALDRIRAQQEVISAPYLSAWYLLSLSAKKDMSTFSRLRGKRIVVTGIVGGQSEGLFGGGPPRIGSSPSGEYIEIDDLGPFDTVEDGQQASVLGTCQGTDAQGAIHLTQCRSIDLTR